MKFKKNLNWFLRVWSLGAVARLLFPTKVVGRELIPDGPFVLVVGPHKTYAETVITPASLSKYEFHIMAKDSLFRIPVFGWIFRNAGGIPVVRTGGNGGKSIAPAVAELGKGYPIMIFPESTRFDDLELHRGKPGAVTIALQANVPIVLGGLRGMHDTTPRPERALHLGLFDPREEFDRIMQLATKPMTEKEAILLVTDIMMEQLAILAGTTYNKDKRDGKA